MSNVVANVDTTASNHKAAKKKEINNWRMFDVPSEVFRKFETGRNKYERWSKYLDSADEAQCEICDYAKKNPKHTIVLRDSTSGVLRQIRRRAANGS